MKLFQWRGRTSKKEFRKRFMELMRGAAPHVEYIESQTDELDLSANGLPNHSTITVSLHRAYDEFVNAPAERDAILARWVASQLRLLDPQPVARKNIVPMIKDRGWLARYYSQYSEPVEPGSARDMLYDEINEEFIVAYADYGGGIHYLHVSDLEEIGLSRIELRALASANLRTRTPERTVKLAGGVWMLHVGGNFESALLIDDDIWRHPDLAPLDPLIIAAPERDCLIVAPNETPADIWLLAFMAQELARDAAYPISSQLMIRRNGRFALLDPDSIDESHPIPRLDVADGSFTASRDTHKIRVHTLVVASPLGGDPRSVFRLFRKLESYLADLGCDGTAEKLAVPADIRPMIYFFMHPDSHRDVLDLVSSFGEYVDGRGGMLELRIQVLT